MLHAGDSAEQIFACDQKLLRSEDVTLRAFDSVG
jgi:hypothetical protein